ncbi:TPA: DNA-binding transcriptional activator BglJ [Raoultella planticola]
MEKRNEAQRIAIIEQCVMTETALRFILNDRYNENSGVHFFKDIQSLTQTMNIRHVTAIIFSLSGHRQLRLESLLFFQEAAYTHPNILRIILANSGEERDLITQLVPFHLHGVLNKSCGRETLQEQLFQLLEQQLAPLNEPASRKALYGHRLSSIEQTILRYIACGHSLSEIAVQLDRNIKTIHAHKYNAMARLGISSALGLLSAADILIHLPPPCGGDAAEAGIA